MILFSKRLKRQSKYYNTIIVTVVSFHFLRYILPRFEVPVKYIQDCHLVIYRQQLLSMILSNSYQSLQHKQDQTTSFDLAALQKSFIDQFVHGRPKIKLDLPDFRFSGDASIFDCIQQSKTKVIIYGCIYY